MAARIRTYLQARRAKAGFTLVETLMALLILVIMTGIVAMGIPVAYQTYTKAVDGSNAQVLLATTTNELRNEFSLAQDCQVVNGTLYYLTGDGYWASLENSADGIKKRVYMGREPGKNEDTASAHLLVSAAAQTDALRVKFADSNAITFADGVFTVNGLQVVRKNDATAVLASIGETAAENKYQVRAITY